MFSEALARVLCKLLPASVGPRLTGGQRDRRVSHLARVPNSVPFLLLCSSLPLPALQVPLTLYILPGFSTVNALDTLPLKKKKIANSTLLAEELSGARRKLIKKVTSIVLSCNRKSEGHPMVEIPQLKLVGKGPNGPLDGSK